MATLRKQTVLSLFVLKHTKKHAQKNYRTNKICNNYHHRMTANPRLLIVSYLLWSSIALTKSSKSKYFPFYFYVLGFLYLSTLVLLYYCTFVLMNSCILLLLIHELLKNPMVFLLIEFFSLCSLLLLLSLIQYSVI